MILDVETLVSRADWTEPVFAQFILDKYKDLKRMEDDAAGVIEDKVFTAQFLTAVLEKGSRFMRRSMWNIVPDRCLTPIMDRLVLGFESVPFAEVENELKQLVKANDLDLYIKRLQTKIEDEITSRPVTLDTFNWMKEHRTLSRDACLGYFERTCPLIEANDSILSGNENYKFLLGNMAHMASELNRPEAVPLVKFFLEEMVQAYDDGELAYYEVGENLRKVLSPEPYSDDGTFELDLFWDLADGYIKEMPAIMAQLYGGGKSGEQLFFIFNSLVMASGHVDERMVLDHIDSIKSPLLVSIVKTLLRDKTLMETLEKEELHHPIMAVFVGLIWRFHRRDKIDAAWFTPENIRELVFLDTEALPCMEQLEAALDAMVPEERSRLLLGAAEDILNLPDREANGDLALENIISLTGRFGDESCLPFLAGLLVNDDEDHDRFVEAARNVLPKFGNAALVHIRAALAQIPQSNLVQVLEIIRLVDSAEAESFLIDHYDRFTAMWLTDALDVAKFLMSNRVLERIAPKVGKGQGRGIDEFYVIVSTLHGKDDGTAREILADLPIPGTEFDDAMELLTSGKAQDVLSLELKCGCCEDVSRYDCHRVIASPSGDAYVAQELTCLACKRICEFRLTENGMMSVTAELIRLSALGQEANGEKDNPFTGALQVMNTAIMGRPMAVLDGIDLYKARIEKKPRQSENYIGLGNIYRGWDQFTLAEAQYKKAIEAGPFYIEPYLSLAEVFIKKREPDTALAWLEKGRPYLVRPVICKDINVTADEIMNGYLTAHSGLIKETGSNITPIRPEEFQTGGKKLTKIGRNEKCPCGSGKKYKKCCMRKH